MKKTALLSVYNKEGVADFARELIELGFNILASFGTAEFLRKEGVSARDISGIVGEPILGHRVVTLSREVHAALLAQESDGDELARLVVPRVDLVCADLYPLEETIALSNNEEEVIDNTDIGGPALLRSAAKGRRIVICDAKDRERVIGWLKEGQPDKKEVLRKLAAKAEMTVARYALASARYASGGDIDGFIGIRAKFVSYGENPWQASAGLFSAEESDALALENFKQIAGGEASYNNFCDLDRVLQTMTHIAAGFGKNFNEVPYIALGAKHGNSCGAAVGGNKEEVLRKMIEGDARAIFGGVIMTNFEIDEELADVLLRHKMPEGQRRLLDGVVSPGFLGGAARLLKRKGDKCRFFENKALLNLWAGSLDKKERFRYVRGGFLKQQNYDFVLKLQESKYARDLILAWAVGATSNSNTVTLVKNGQLLGNGVGQQDRVGCCELAIKRARDAGHDTSGAVSYSDSFFPFTDGPEVLVKAGIKAILASGGSVRDEEVKSFCAENNIWYRLVSDKVIRGFFGH